MPLLTYLKSAVSSWLVHQDGPIREFYLRSLRPRYIRFAARIEEKQWREMGLDLQTEASIQQNIRRALAERVPFTLAKIGATEYFMLRWILGEKVSEKRIHDLYHLSGVFPRDLSFFRDFGISFQQCLRSLDVLGIWTGKDEPAVYRNLELKSAITHFSYFSGNFPRVAAGGWPGWFSELSGYRVMVISSFAELIASRANQESWNQYWGDRFPWIAPKSLVAIPFPYGFDPETEARYGNSLNLLQEFKLANQTTLEQCDIVLAGCGAYAIPILDWVRSHGKVGVHMGGDIQLLFGIKGARWDQVDGLYNDHWVRPSVHLTPKAAGRVENSCYW